MTAAVVFSIVLFTACAAAPAVKEFDVKDFDARADGKTDCTAAIQQAIDAAGKAGGGRVVIPAADSPYLVRNTITIRCANIEIAGSGATLKLADSAATSSDTHVLHVVGAAGREIANVAVRGLTIDANFWNQEQALTNRWTPRGFLVEHARAVVVDGVHVTRAWVSLAFSVGANECEAVDCAVSQWHNDGFDAGNGASNIRFSRCRAHNAMNDNRGGPPGRRDSAWEIEDGARSITLSDCLVEGADGEGFTVRSHDTKTVTRDIRFIRCKVSDPIRRAWLVVGRDHDTRTERVLLKDCSTPGELECGTGVDLVRIEGGEFGRVTLNAPRRVRLIGVAVEEMTIDAKQRQEGAERYHPSIVLEDVKLDRSRLTISGNAKAVRVVGASAPSDAP